MADNVVEFRGRGGSVSSPPDTRRWQVDIEYRSEGGGQLAIHYIEELSELDALVEQGPHWDTIVKMAIALNRPSSDIPRLTKEQADIL